MNGKTQTERLRLDQIRLDFQPPENLDEERVREYILKIQSGEALLPIVVRFDGASYFCQDGFHRIEASKRIGRETIEASVTPGTLAEMEEEFRDYLKRLKDSLRRETTP